MNFFSKVEIRYIINTAIKAGDIILKYYNKDFNYLSKKDGSPLTEADLVANKCITSELKKFFPNIPIISEEKENNYLEKGVNDFFLVDPLDGTKEFINKNDDFTVNIAFIKNNISTIGVIYIPVKRQIYWTDGYLSFSQKINKKEKVIRVNRFDEKNIKVELSRSHFDIKTKKFIERINFKQKKFTGSSLKICNLASGKSNLYPRFGKTMEWDIAAGHAILNNAGGQIFSLRGGILKYNKDKFINESFFAISDRKFPKSMINIFNHLE